MNRRVWTGTCAAMISLATAGMLAQAPAQTPAQPPAQPPAPQQSAPSSSDTKIVVMKDTERFEIARTADSKVTGDLKVGTKVTIKYSMTAKSIEAKK